MQKIARIFEAEITLLVTCVWMGVLKQNVANETDRLTELLKSSTSSCQVVHDYYAVYLIGIRETNRLTDISTYKKARVYAVKDRMRERN